MKKRKWLIVLAVVVVLAVVLTIVFINLFTPKHTTELANQINSIAQTGYLNKENSNYQKIESFLTDLQSNTKLDEINSDKARFKKIQIENYAKSLEAFAEMAQFYDRELIFTQHTKVYADNADSIMKSLKSANSTAGELANYFQDRGLDEQTCAEAWLSKEGQMKSLFNNTYNAFTRLSSVYTSCVTSKMMNNEMSKAVFKVTNYLLKNVKADLEINLDENDIQFYNGDILLSFVKVYYPKANAHMIYNVDYDEKALAIAKQINETEDLSGFNRAEWNKFVSGDIYSTIALSGEVA